MRIPMASIREVAREALAVFRLFAMAGVVYWVLLAIVGCGPIVGFEPSAKQDDVVAVAEKVDAIQQDQTGLVNAQANIKSEITGLRKDVTNTIDRQVDPWVGYALLMLIAFNGLDALGELIRAIRAPQAMHPP